MSLKVITNGKPREIEYKIPVDPSIEEDGDLIAYVNYRGNEYEIGEFMRVQKDGELAKLGWHGVHGESYFSGILIKILDDGTVIMGRYYEKSDF